MLKLITVPIAVLLMGVIHISCDERPEEGYETILEPIQPVFDPAAPTKAIGGSSEQKLAQTFRVNREGTLTGIFLPLACSSGELNVEIRDVTGEEPGTAILSSQRFNADTIVTEITVFKLFNLPDLAVSGGERLTLVLTNPSGTCGLSTGPVGDSYTDGEGFFDARPNAPGWIRFSDFDSTAQDLAFQVLLEGV